MSLHRGVAVVVRLPQRDGAPQRGQGSHPAPQTVGSRRREAQVEENPWMNICPEDCPEDNRTPTIIDIDVDF